MSSPGQSSGTSNSADLFEDLWRRLGECHQNAFQELEAKVSKLKKERCLDAQRLEVFFTRTQQLKEQNKGLQDAISLLEERLHAGECNRCGILEENLKNNQDQNLRLITKLKNEKNSLEDENRNLQAELQKLKMSRSEPLQASSPEHEDGIIPDSPVLPSSLPVVNKLRKPRNLNKMKRVRYTEIPLPQSNNSLFRALDKEPVEAAKNPGRTQVLVPNTCEMDMSQTSISNDVTLNLEEAAIAETCGLELVEKNHMMTPGQQSSSNSFWKNSLKPHCSASSSTRLHSPDSTSERSPSLLPSVKRFSENGSFHKAKRKKEESEPEDKQGVQEGVDKQKENKHGEPELIKRTSTTLNNQSFQKELLDSKVWSPQSQMSVSCASPVFKKPNVKREANKGGAGTTRNPRHDLMVSHEPHAGKDAERRRSVEPTWSMDPALALSMYDSERRTDEQIEEEKEEEEEEEEECHEDLADTDRTWVSHSLLLGRGQHAQDSRDSVSGLGKKANDSLDMMFDTTAYGEYKSCNSSHFGQSQLCDDDHDNEEEEKGNDEQQDPDETTVSQMNGRKPGRPTFAHVAVVRKKEERRKLKGTTCKECDIYYAHLPEEEKEKKLSACSRHRFLYIPPSTPENFWEVGFPSTQTCIERGYIREEKNPQARTRRRQPFNALFSPRRNQQES